MITAELRTRMVRVLQKKEITIREINKQLDAAGSMPRIVLNEANVRDVWRQIDLWVAELSFIIDQVGLFIYRDELQQMCSRVSGRGDPQTKKPTLLLLKESLYSALTRRADSGNESFVTERFHIEGYIRELASLTDNVSEVIIGDLDYRALDHDEYEPIPDIDEVFVIMSFSSQMDEVFEMAIESAINKCGLRAYRVDREEPHGLITQDILQKIRQLKLVIGDLTHERPNCYYELGYAKALRKRLILTCRKDHDPRGINRREGDPKVHFDLDSQKITFWHETDLAQFRRDLIIRIQTLVGQ